MKKLRKFIKTLLDFIKPIENLFWPPRFWRTGNPVGVEMLMVGVEMLTVGVEMLTVGVEMLNALRIYVPFSCFSKFGRSGDANGRSGDANGRSGDAKLPHP